MRPRFTPHLTLSFILLCSHAFANTVTLCLDNASPQWEISPYLCGIHQEYMNIPDEIIANGPILPWVKSHHIPISRFPGGTLIKYWDWRAPTGHHKADTWSPDWHHSQQVPSSQWMSLDEYLLFVKNTGITPMFGINALSGLKYNRLDDGIQRACDMLHYIMDKGHNGTLWYFGNEEIHLHGGIAKYAKHFAKYTQAMKAIDPTIKVFWNDNNPTPERVQTFLMHDDGLADGIEIHSKWPYAGEYLEEHGHVSYNEWLLESPMRFDRRYEGKIPPIRKLPSYIAEIATNSGRPELLIMNNEWGLGRPATLKGFSRYLKNLAMAEYAMEFYHGNWFASCYWDLANKMGGGQIGIFDAKNQFRINPIGQAFSLLTPTNGGRYLRLSSPTSSISGFGSLQKQQTIAIILNKAPFSQSIKLEASAQLGADVKAVVMEESYDGYAAISPLPVITSPRISFSLPASSLLRLEFKHP